MTDYDAVVIGSGSGGLTAALALARSGKKVVVYEQHDHPGGYTKSFALNGFTFSPGVHYVGGLDPGGSLRRIYEGLGGRHPRAVISCLVCSTVRASFRRHCPSTRGDVERLHPQVSASPV